MKFTVTTSAFHSAGSTFCHSQHKMKRKGLEISLIHVDCFRQIVSVVCILPLKMNSLLTLAHTLHKDV